MYRTFLAAMCSSSSRWRSANPPSPRYHESASTAMRPRFEAPSLPGRTACTESKDGLLCRRDPRRRWGFGTKDVRGVCRQASARADGAAAAAAAEGAAHVAVAAQVVMKTTATTGGSRRTLRDGEEIAARSRAGSMAPSCGRCCLTLCALLWPCCLRSFGCLGRCTLPLSVHPNLDYWNSLHSRFEVGLRQQQRGLLVCCYGILLVDPPKALAVHEGDAP